MGKDGRNESLNLNLERGRSKALFLLIFFGNSNLQDFLNRKSFLSLSVSFFSCLCGLVSHVGFVEPRECSTSYSDFGYRQLEDLVVKVGNEQL